MALRLTGTSPLPVDAGGPAGGVVVPPASGGAPGTGLAAEARVLLAAGQLDGYRALFARAADDEDPHARYHARVLLLEEGLAAAGRGSSAARTAQLFAAVAQGGLDGLEEEPREPVLLGYTGVALCELWALDAARALFQAAGRLDPSLPHLSRNLDELKRRGRIAGRSGRSMRPLHAAVPALAGRAKRVADRARPATGLKLSLCMIVRDEEEMLPRCLGAVAPAVDEIVIVDTGSRDRTIEIARSFGARVIEREWTGSFADARNVSFDAATGDWLMYLDADEILVSEDVERLRALTGRTWREAFYLVETNYTGEVGDGTAVTNNALRIFRARAHYRFEGRLHEQIAHHLPTYAPGRIEQTSVRIEHYGYLGAVRNAREKSRRNIELLRAQQVEGADSPFLHFNLGTEFAAIGDSPAALSEFERAWTMVKSRGEERRDYVPALAVRLVTALRLCGRAAEAIASADEGLTLFPGFTDLVFAQALASVALGSDSDAVAYWERCIEMGDAPARYGSTVGSGTYLPRIALAELHAQRAELEPARALLDWCLAEHPDFVGVIQPYASVLLRGGATPAAVTAEIEERVPAVTPTVRFMLASALFGQGAMAAAEHQYRAVLAARPRSSQVRVALAEALLHQRRYADATAEAVAVGDDDPFAPLACRIELWGRIAAGDTDGARAASTRAAEVGVPSVELEVFAGWAALAAGQAEPHRLPVAATPLLGVILETMLRVHDFEGFEALLPLLEHSELPAREQREVLGAMYLRYGFLASAAKEWMAVCETEPDARALVGLARVAAAHGTTEDAAVFAAEALRLDPGNAAATEILARGEAPAAVG